MKILTELHYLPTIPWFAAILNASELILEQHENYSKRSFRNRTHIATSNGLLRLTIPLKKGKNQQLPIKEVEISYDEPWQHQHWTAIQSGYGKAPYFEFYAEDLRVFYEKPYPYLFDFNLQLLEKMFFLLRLKPTFGFSATFTIYSEFETKDLRNKINPKEIALHPYNPIHYSQVFLEKHGFIPNLSILDLLFCTGPEAVGILKKSILSNDKYIV